MRKIFVFSILLSGSTFSEEVEESSILVKAIINAPFVNIDNEYSTLNYVKRVYYKFALGYNYLVLLGLYIGCDFEFHDDEFKYMRRLCHGQMVAGIRF